MQRAIGNYEICYKMVVVKNMATLKFDQVKNMKPSLSLSPTPPPSPFSPPLFQPSLCFFPSHLPLLPSH